MLGLTVFIREQSEKIPTLIICDQEPQPSQCAALVQDDDDARTPLSLDSLPMKANTICVHDFAVQNLSTTLQTRVMSSMVLFHGFIPLNHTDIPADACP